MRKPKVGWDVRYSLATLGLKWTMLQLMFLIHDYCSIIIIFDKKQITVQLWNVRFINDGKGCLELASLGFFRYVE